MNYEKTGTTFKDNMKSQVYLSTGWYKRMNNQIPIDEHQHDNGFEEWLNRQLQAMFYYIEKNDLCPDCFQAYCEDIDGIIDIYSMLNGHVQPRKVRLIEDVLPPPDIKQIKWTDPLEDILQHPFFKQMGKDWDR
jgi:hypothetical protein